MTAIQARKKALKEKRGAKAVRSSTTKAKAKLKTQTKTVFTKKTSTAKASGRKRSPMIQNKAAKRTRSRATEERTRFIADSSSRTVSARAAAVVEPPPRLLRESKSMTAALAMLEKGIRLLYQKDIKRARAEFNSLIESHPGEAEILARTRSYLQICDREETLRKKAGVTTSDYYSLGVIEHNRGDYEGAISSFRKALDQHPDAEHIHYSLAASLALRGEPAAAIQALRRAIDLNEDNRVYAKNDTDFNSLHANKDFIDLVGMSSNPAGVSNLS